MDRKEQIVHARHRAYAANGWACWHPVMIYDQSEDRLAGCDRCGRDISNDLSWSRHLILNAPHIIFHPDSPQKIIKCDDFVIYEFDGKNWSRKGNAEEEDAAGSFKSVQDLQYKIMSAPSANRMDLIKSLYDSGVLSGYVPIAGESRILCYMPPHLETGKDGNRSFDIPIKT